MEYGILSAARRASPAGPPPTVTTSYISGFERVLVEAKRRLLVVFKVFRHCVQMKRWLLVGILIGISRDSSTGGCRGPCCFRDVLVENCCDGIVVCCLIRPEVVCYIGRERFSAFYRLWSQICNLPYCIFH